MHKIKAKFPILTVVNARKLVLEINVNGEVCLWISNNSIFNEQVMTASPHELQASSVIPQTRSNSHYMRVKYWVYLFLPQIVEIYYYNIINNS